MSAPGRVVTVLLTLIVATLLAAPLHWPELRREKTWLPMASPGRLSSAHAFLENDCASCHTPVKGPEATKCIACHANDETLLGRQPTKFHAEISSCRECHPEHQGLERLPTTMDHEALAKIGLRTLKARPATTSARDELLAWIRQNAPEYSTSSGVRRLTAAEAALDCATCHATKDRHRGFFGEDCAECHGTDTWTVAGFRHPSEQSTDCAQCHQAPPSHYMEHFHIISARIAHQEHAQVDQCFLCHQTTAWNDIKGIGYYKHH